MVRSGDVAQIFLSTNIEPIFDMTLMRWILFVMHGLRNRNDVCLVAVLDCLKQQLPVIPTAWNLLISTTFKSCYPCQSFARIIAMRQTYKQVSLLQSYWHFMLDVVINVVVCVVRVWCDVERVAEFCCLVCVASCLHCTRVYTLKVTHFPSTKLYDIVLGWCFVILFCWDVAFCNVENMWFNSSVN